MFGEFSDRDNQFGMIGVIVVGVVLAGLSGLGFAYMSGSPSSSGPSYETRVEEQTPRLESLEDKVEQQRLRLNCYQEREAKIQLSASLLGELEDLTRAKDEMVSLHTKLMEESAKTRQDHEDYKVAYRKRERESAKGEIIDLSSLLGSRYRKSRIVEVVPTHLKIMHSSGTKAIPYQELPLELQDRFQFCSEEVAEYEVSYREMVKSQQRRRARGPSPATLKRRDDAARGKIDQKIAKLEAQIKKCYDDRANYRDLAKELRSEIKQLRLDERRSRSSGRISNRSGKINSAIRKSKECTQRAEMLGKKAKLLEEKLAQLDAERRKLL